MASSDLTTTQPGKATAILLVLIRWFLGGYFIHSGVNKVLEPVGFLKAIHLYDMLPTEPAVYLNATAIILPWLEIVCGIALVLGLWRRGAALVIGLMLCVFTPAILFRALAVQEAEGKAFVDIAFDCGCGTGPQIIWKKLCTNGGLILLAIITLISSNDKLCLGRCFSKDREAANKPPVPTVDAVDTTSS